jgi:putative FmdB family regulatory protein
MPMYEFTCRACGHPFEKKLRMSQVGDALACPNCGSDETQRRFSTAVAVGGIGHSHTAVAAPPIRSPFT